MQGTIALQALSSKEFCEAIAAELVLRRRKRIPLGDEAVEKAFGEIAKDLREKAVEAYKTNKDVAHAIQRVLDGIRPNQNTGTFDALWSTLRSLAPGVIETGNPMLEALNIRVTEANAKADLNDLSDEWADLVKLSADRLAKVL